MKKKPKCFNVPVPFTNDDIADIERSGKEFITINGVSVKKDSNGYYQSRTTNAVVRLIIMLANGLIYSRKVSDADSRIGKLIEEPAKYNGSYKYSVPQEHIDEFASMSGEPAYRSSDIGSVQDYLYLCAVAQLYILNIRQT